MQANIRNTTAPQSPVWVPDAARIFLAHTENGRTIRDLARQSKVHVSTILRQVRRFEVLRDDPLFDGALRQLSQCIPDGRQNHDKVTKNMNALTSTAALTQPVLSESHIEQEAVRVLRRMSGSGVMLAVAVDMEMGVVVRDSADGVPQRIAVVERCVAEAMALKDWIQCSDPGSRIARYHISGAGRAALKRILTTAASESLGFSEARADFDRGGTDLQDDGVIRHLRSTLAESPLAGPARRRVKDGVPFLDRALVAAGGRLREDFELSQIGIRIPENWERFLAALETVSDGGQNVDTLTPGQKQAHDRVRAALTDLGPGLAEVALRCCCFLERLGNLEKRLSWSARSGKIVLRIALRRLQQHYLQSQGKFGPKIGWVRPK
jgi:hypothetical protein